MYGDLKTKKNRVGKSKGRALDKFKDNTFAKKYKKTLEARDENRVIRREGR